MLFQVDHTKWVIVEGLEVVQIKDYENGVSIKDVESLAIELLEPIF